MEGDASWRERDMICKVHVAPGRHLWSLQSCMWLQALGCAAPAVLRPRIGLDTALHSFPAILGTLLTLDETSSWGNASSWSGHHLCSCTVLYQTCVTATFCSLVHTTCWSSYAGPAPGNDRRPTAASRRWEVLLPRHSGTLLNPHNDRKEKP
jgi:hypothetical protein